MPPVTEPPTRGRILIVDDQETNRYVFRRILSRAGYSIDEAGTGEEGLAKTMLMPDLVIVDVNLPDMLGYDVCRRIKANPIIASIPVLQISASFLSDESRVHALEGGADSYLIQPIEPMVLTAQVQALLRLRKAEKLSHLSAVQWQNTFDALSDGLALVDVGGTVLRVNRAFLRQLNLVRSRAEGRRIEEIFQQAFGMALPEFVGRSTAGEGGELQCGSNWFRVRYDRIDSDGTQESGWILLITDVTDHKKLQETLKMSERLAATGRLAHTIAHEINNPLESLCNLLYIVQNNPQLDVGSQGYLHQASLELDRISQITKQILAYHRDSRQPIATRIDEMIDGLFTMFRVRIPAGRIRVTKRLDSSRLVCVNPGEMRQALGNILSNALDAIGPLGGSLVVHCFNAVDQKTRRRGVRLVFSDSGGGIPASAYPRIFDAFYTTKELKGSGIGLWLTSEVIAKHEGRIRVRSRTDGPYRGTLFDIFLPEFLQEDEGDGATEGLQTGKSASAGD